MLGKDLVKLLKQNGFVELRVEGSHHYLEKDGIKISVPVHAGKDVKKGLLNRNLKDAGLK